jgi:type IV secretion system protein VirB2
MKNRTSFRPSLFAVISSLLLMAVMTEPAYAQLAPVTNLANTILRTLQVISLALVTAALIWAGFKMIWQHAKWAEISNVFIGTMIIGGAGTIATTLMVA